MTVSEEFFGTFTLRGFHPVCPNGCEDVYTSKLFRDERRIMKSRMQEMLLKNYPVDKYEYFGIETLAALEKKSIPELLKRDDLYFPIFFFSRNHRHFYLKKSYELYKREGVNGWFDISVPEPGNERASISRPHGKTAYDLDRPLSKDNDFWADMQILKVVPHENYDVELWFADGSHKIRNLKKIIDEVPEISALKDLKVFMNIRRFGWSILWDDDVSLDAYEFFRYGKEV